MASKAALAIPTELKDREGDVRFTNVRNGMMTYSGTVYLMKKTHTVYKSLRVESAAF